MQPLPLECWRYVLLHAFRRFVAPLSLYYYIIIVLFRRDVASALLLRVGRYESNQFCAERLLRTGMRETKTTRRYRILI